MGIAMNDADAARRQRDAGRERREADQRLEQDRQQHQAAVEHEAEQRDERQTGRVRAVLQDMEIDDRMSDRELPDRSGRSGSPPR